MAQVNISQLANELSLSISTVSKALKDSHEISAKTKERVLTLARKLNYTPNPYASSLRRKKSNTIAVVIPDVADSFFSLALKGIEAVAQTKQYHVLVYLTYESYEKEKKILEDFCNGRVDGVLMSVSSETHFTPHVKAMTTAKIPLVFFDRAIEEMKTAKVQTNDRESGYKAALHLIEQGCRRIAFLSISTHLDINQKRLAGYQAALSDHSYPFQEQLVIHCTNDAAKNYEILLAAMKQPNRPDGLVVSVEKLITPLYLACKALALSLPTDVKVVGFSNIATAQILDPALTTITQPAFEMGKAAATILFKALEKRAYHWQGEQIIMPSELFVRASTAIDRSADSHGNSF